MESPETDTESPETDIESISTEQVEMASLSQKTTTVTASESAQTTTATLLPVGDSVKVGYDTWEQVQQFLGKYFGDGKKANVILLATIIATIPTLIAISALVNFLDRLPLLSSIFELVGFGYSIWFVYRYLLLANTRKELIDGITGWKSKIFG